MAPMPEGHQVTEGEIRFVRRRGYLRTAQQALWVASVDEMCWKDRLRKLGMPEYMLSMVVLAVADFLRPPIKIPNAPAWKKSKAKEEARNRRSAFFWLFDEAPDEMNFRAFCEAVGLDVDRVREKLLTMQYYLHRE